MSRNIPIAGPSITDLEIEYVSDAARTGWFGGAGAYTRRFEAGFAEYLGLSKAVSLPSCTSGLHLALAAMGVGPGDEVIVPDITWIATSAPVDYVGAEVVFADVDPVTWCLDLDSTASLITERTKAVIAVDLYGSMPDWDGLRALADKHSIRLIEDSAEAVGSEYHGRRAGSLGDVGVFSFHGSKTLTTGEGGLLATDDAELFDRIMFLRDHGRVPGDTSFQNAEVAFKYKMSDMQAAMGLAQLERVDELVGKKREIFDWYRTRLGADARLQLNAEPEDTLNSYWMSSVIVTDEIDLPKDRLIADLAERGISTRPFFSALSGIPAYRARAGGAEARARNTVSARLGKQSINLPSSLSLTEDDIDFACAEFLKILSAV